MLRIPRRYCSDDCDSPRLFKQPSLAALPRSCGLTISTPGNTFARVVMASSSFTVFVIVHPTLGAFRILEGFKYRSAGDVVHQVEGQPSYTRRPGFSP